MLAAAKANGVTTIKNAAKEPEIVDLQNFINAMGGKIRGAGGSEIIITGVKNLHGVKYSVIPDRIVLSTYMCAVAATRGNAVFKNVNTSHVSSVLAALSKAGCKIYDLKDTVAIECDRLSDQFSYVDAVSGIPDRCRISFCCDDGRGGWDNIVCGNDF